jgi:gas vesicle protein
MTDQLTLTADERLVRPVAAPTTQAEALAEKLPLADRIDIEKEIAYVDACLAKYVAEKDKALEPFRATKVRVAERQKETRFFLGVIGEFSSGKSSLINALIRENLLKMDVLQGTTSAATLLYFGDSFTVDVRRRKKNIIVRAVTGLAGAVKGLFSKPIQPTRDDLVQLLHKATTEEEFAKDVVQVDVRLPSDRLRKGLVVVDTPGANAANPRHGLVTVAALRDVCDAALVVVPAEAAGAESLFKFLKEHAADVLYRCVFVVTKIDLIRRERERSRVIENLRSRINQQLQIAQPRVVACAPQFVVESLVARASAGSEFTAEEIASWLGQFTDMERELDTMLRQKRLIAQTDDVAKLVSQLFDLLQDLLDKRRKGYKERHEALARIVIPDIGEFIEQRIQKHVQSCETRCDKAASASGQKYGSLVSEIIADMSKAISSADSQKELREAVESKIPGIYSYGQGRLRRLTQSVISEMSSAGQDELKTFHNEFQKHFQDLATLGGALAIDKPDAHALARTFSDRAAAANSAIAAELKGLQQQQTNQAFGLAAGGAVVGTMVFPGIGTIIGGVIGGVLSMFFGPSLDQLKNECWSKIQPQVVDALKDFARSADDAFEDVMKSTARELRERIASYQPRYEVLVQKMKDRDAAEKVQLEELQAKLQVELNDIAERRGHLDRVRQQMRDL